MVDSYKRRLGVWEAAENRISYITKYNFECFIPFHCAWLFIVVIIIVIVVYLCQTLRKGVISITTLKDYEIFTKIFTKILRKFTIFFFLVGITISL